MAEQGGEHATTWGQSMRLHDEGNANQGSRDVEHERWCGNKEREHIRRLSKRKSRRKRKRERERERERVESVVCEVMGGRGDTQSGVQRRHLSGVHDGEDERGRGRTGCCSTFVEK